MIKDRLVSSCVRFQPKEKLLFLYVDYQYIQNIILSMGQTCSPTYECEIQQQIEQNNQQLYNFIKQNIKRSTFAVSQQISSIVANIITKGYHRLGRQDYGLAYIDKIGYYQGQLSKYNKPEGTGKLIFQNFDQYNGQFKNSKFDGVGTIQNRNKSITLKATWIQGYPISGELCHNMQNIVKKYQITKIQKCEQSNIYFVEMKFPDKMIYKGNVLYKPLKNNIFMFHGKGRVNFPDGSSYQGDWINGLMDGQGKYFWGNGSFYQGGYTSGLKNGWGILFLPSKDIEKQQNKLYQGQWLMGKPHIKSIIQSQSSSQNFDQQQNS